jgi:signal transduction histidine kinase
LIAAPGVAVTFASVLNPVPSNQSYPVRFLRLLRSAAFRFSAIYGAVFGVSVVILGFFVYWITDAALERQLRSRLQVEATLLESRYSKNSADKFLSYLEKREQSQKSLGFLYFVSGPELRRQVNTLDLETPSPGWSTQIKRDEDSGETSNIRVFTIYLEPGVALSVGKDLSNIADTENAILNAFAWVAGATVVLALAGGLFISSRFLARVDGMAQAAEQIIDGDLEKRLPSLKSGDELDFLAQTLNRMLDRINELMESLRQVSSDIAHDLRTPLSRLRQSLEAAVLAPRPAEELRYAINNAIDETDGILATFGALLRIAQIEAGTRRRGFASFDLSALVADVAEAFGPSIQDEGKFLKTFVEDGVTIVGDRELLTQLLANLLENSIRHTGAGTSIEVKLSSSPDVADLIVADNGPGVPTESHEKLFDRFYRPEARSTPGSGLGLSLVKAIANLHNAKIALHHNNPGLLFEFHFPRRATLPIGGAGSKPLSGAPDQIVRSYNPIREQSV